MQKPAWERQADKEFWITMIVMVLAVAGIMAISKALGPPVHSYSTPPAASPIGASR